MTSFFIINNESPLLKTYEQEHMSCNKHKTHFTPYKKLKMYKMFQMKDKKNRQNANKLIDCNCYTFFIGVFVWDSAC